MNAKKSALWAQRRPDLVTKYEDELVLSGVIPAGKKRKAQARKRARGGKYKKRRKR